VVNKGFSADFQKLLNMYGVTREGCIAFIINPSRFAYYATPTRMDTLVPFLADLICVVWAKEAVLENVWTLIAPPSAPSSTASLVSNAEPLAAIPVRSGKAEPKAQKRQVRRLKLSDFDRALLYLLHRILWKLTAQDGKSAVDLCLNGLFPKLQQVGDGSFAQLLMVVILCSVSTRPEIYNR